jgi:hypothetical protein
LYSIFLFTANLADAALAKSQSCVLLGPAGGREWAIKKLVAVLPAENEQDAAIPYNKS